MNWWPRKKQKVEARGGLQSQADQENERHFLAQLAMQEQVLALRRQRGVTSAPAAAPPPTAPFMSSYPRNGLEDMKHEMPQAMDQDGEPADSEELGEQGGAQDAADQMAEALAAAVGGG